MTNCLYGGQQVGKSEHPLPQQGRFYCRSWGTWFDTEEDFRVHLQKMLTPPQVIDTDIKYQRSQWPR